MYSFDNQIILDENLFHSITLFYIKMKKLVLLFLSICMSYGFFGQTKTTGIVFDAFTNLPMENVNVILDGKTTANTNKNGEFSLNCSTGKILVFQKEGYKDFSEKIINCAQVLNIGMVSLSQNLDAIEITESSNPDKSMLVQPLSIVKMSDLEIKRGTGLYLNDAINTNVPGVYMQSRGNASGQNFNIRGYGNGLRGTNGANSNFDGQGTKVYLNGILITDAEGVTALDDIDFGSVSNVEISKGPSGTLYGLAIAGVVNMQTRKAAPNTNSIHQDVLFGSYGLMRSTTSLEIGGKRSSIMLNYGKQKFDGFMPHTAAHKDFVNAMGEFYVSEKQTISTYLAFTDSYDQRNGELTIGQYDTLNYSGNPAYIKNNAHSAFKTFRGGVSSVYKFNNRVSNTTSVFGSSQLLDYSSAGGWGDKTSLNYGFRSTVDLNFKLSDKIGLTSISGVEFQKMNALTAGYSMGTDSTNITGYNVITSLKSLQATTNSTGSAFTQWTMNLPKDISVTAGVGYSVMNIALDDRLWGTSGLTPSKTTPKGYKANYKDMLSPSFSINKRINKLMSAYATYSVGYKAPVSSYFFIPTTGQVNTGLKPEKGVQLEVGTKGNLLKNKLFYTVAYFNAQFQNKMTAVTVQNPTNTATLYSYIANGGSLNNNGLEVLVKYEAITNAGGFFTSLRPFANLTYSDFKYKDYRFETIKKTSGQPDSTIVNDFSGKIVAGVPKIVFNLGVDAQTKIGLYGNLTFNYRDAMYYTSDNVNQTEAYSLLNAKIGYKRTISKFTFDIYAAANNITSTQYYYMVFLNQLPDAYIPAPNAINYFGGVNLKYNF